MSLQVCLFLMHVNKAKVINCLILALQVSKNPLELIFSDVWGPATGCVGRKQYYVSIIDDYSKFS
jgi:hypothetical protein